MSLARFLRPLMEDLVSIESQLNRGMLFPSITHANWPGIQHVSPTAMAWAQRQPRFAVHETDKEIVVEAETPGFKKENLAVELDGSRLLIRGLQEVKEMAATEGAEAGASAAAAVPYNRQQFSQSLQLPPELKNAPITAKYENGVLRVRLQKPEGVKPKPVTIAIEGGDAPAGDVKIDSK